MNWWGEVHVPRRSLGMREPGHDRFGLVCRQIVKHDVDLQVLYHGRVNEPDEGEDLFRRVLVLGVIEHLTSRHRRTELEPTSRRRATS